METDKNKIDLDLSEKILKDQGKKEVIKQTYEAYSNSDVNFLGKVSNKKDSQDEDYELEQALNNRSSEIEKRNATPKKINFDVQSIENLTPELQDSIKKLLNSRNTKNEVTKLIREIEVEKNKFLKKQDGVFGKMNEREMELLEKKLAETEISQEVTEVNLTAIVSCLNNIMSN